MVWVSGGRFKYGCNKKVDTQCDDDEVKLNSIYLDGFWIDKYEVSVSKYRTCVEEGTCNRLSSSGNCNWSDLPGDRENYPINCIDWHQAKAYCSFKSRRLPTEEEWEKAARGTDGRKYSWGNPGYASLDTPMAKHC